MKLRWHGSLAVGLGVAASLAVAAPTLAAPSKAASHASRTAAARTLKLTGGTITVTPDVQIVRILGIAGASTAQLTNDGVVSSVPWGLDIPLSISGGSFDVRTGTGTFDSATSVSIAARPGTAELGPLTFNTRTGVAKDARKELALTGGTLTRTGSNVTVSGVQLTVTRALAKELNKADGDGAITAGMVFGTATFAATGK